MWQTYVMKALNEMAFRFHSGRMISIFPERLLLILPMIVFLSRSPRDQMGRFRNDLSFADISGQKLDMVRTHHVVNHTQSITLHGLEKPPEITAPVPSEFQKKFLFVTPMGNLPP